MNDLQAEKTMKKLLAKKNPGALLMDFTERLDVFRAVSGDKDYTRSKSEEFEKIVPLIKDPVLMDGVETFRRFFAKYR